MKQKKSKDCPGCGAVLPLACRECRLCDYQFTSKSMTVSNQSQTLESTQIREKFLFEPDRVFMHHCELFSHASSIFI